MSHKTSVSIDGRRVEIQVGSSVLEACLNAGIYVPHLCSHPDLTPRGSCGLCLVEIQGMPEPVNSCLTAATNGMVIRTQSAQLSQMRRSAMEYILAAHPDDCGTCVKYLNCELQSLKQYFSIDKLGVERRPRLFPVDSSNPLLVIDPNKCVLCGRCLKACHELRGVGVLFRIQTENEAYIGTVAGQPLADAGCRFCGACAEVCPTGAIMDKQELIANKSRKAGLVPCRYACPAEIEVPAYLRLIRNGDYAGAVDVIREKVPFPRVLGHVCDHPCESACRRGHVNQPISIRNLKRFAAEHEKPRTAEDATRKPATGQRVAVIGSGPAGLTAAYYLALRGHAVTVLEALPQPGGMLRYGVPRYRLPETVIDSEISDIVRAGVKIRTSTHLDSLDNLLKEGYAAILVAVGTHQGQKLPIPGANHPQALVGVDFLRDVNLGRLPSIGRSVLVLGGGNVAFDCARVARRLGASTVRVACLEPLDALPAATEEVQQACEEGIEVYPSRSFSRVVVEDNQIKGVQCSDVISFRFDEDRNLQVETEPGSNHIIPAETVIFATGQRPLIPEGMRLNTRPNGTIELDEFTWATSLDGVFAAGDVTCGTSSVIQAIASGRKAATVIDRFLGGSGDIDATPAPRAPTVAIIGRQDCFAHAGRGSEPTLSAEDRLHCFCEVTTSMASDAAEAEAGRCLQCDLRLNIKRPKIWSDY